jgi:hypothetical protein
MPEFTDPLIVKDSTGNTGFHFDPTNGWLIVGSNGKQGNIAIKNSDDRIIFESASQDAVVYVWGGIIARDFSSKIDTMTFSTESATLSVGGTGKPGFIWVFDGNNNKKIILDGNAGDIALPGADCAEEFNVVVDSTINPGTVLVINDEDKLCPCEIPYDKRVAGIVSGANGHSPGIILGKKHGDSHKLPIALTGKVYCNVDAQYSPVRVGDLLTTSSTRGYAMKAEDQSRVFGAVIGKALGSMKEGIGMIPVLVALQ